MMQKTDFIDKELKKLIVELAPKVNEWCFLRDMKNVFIEKQKDLKKPDETI